MFKILYINDVHFSGTFKPLCPKTDIAVPKFFSLLQTRAKEFDLLVIGGDIVNHGPVRAEELKQFHEALTKTGVPFRVVAGNHDMSVNNRKYAEKYPDIERWEDCSLEETNYGRLFGIPGIRDTLMVDGIKLVFFSIRNEDTDGQLSWLESELADGVPAMLFCHFPLVLTRTGGFCSWWGYNRIASVRQSLTDLILNHNKEIPAYFCGHHHINSRVKIGQTEQIVTGALGLATCCYRIIEINSCAVNISTHRLPGITNWLDDIMYPEQSTDVEHDSIEAYHWGNEEERNFTITRK
ncbi:MAG: metallophosphoesterase [Spirochaetales bacterium]|nr:metallophosphoesterase [Spirochaetales bacterium]